jgi:hypothetical protein
MAIIASGIGTGIALSIKPHFAFAVILAAAATAYHAKSWRPLFAPEHWIAGGIVAAYGASVFIFYPQFISDILPLAQAVYVPARRPWLAILAGIPALLWLLSIFLLAMRQRGAVLQPRFSVLSLASCGFALAFVVQGKGWPYHSYPMLVLALLALAVFSSRSEGTMPASAVTMYSKINRLASLALIALVGAGFYVMTLATDFTPLAEMIRRNSVEPKILVISANIGLGHPLVRQAGGKWAQRVGSLWISDNAEWLLKTEKSPIAAARLEYFAARDHAMLREDIRREKPDIILLGMDWETRVRSDPAFPGILSAYSEVSRKDGVIILGRNDRKKPQ